MTSQSTSTVISSCTERDFLETIHAFDRHGDWACAYCGEAISYPAGSDSVFLGSTRLECVVESINGFLQLRPREGGPGGANRCCSDGSPRPIDGSRRENDRMSDLWRCVSLRAGQPVGGVSAYQGLYAERPRLCGRP